MKTHFGRSGHRPSSRKRCGSVGTGSNGASVSLVFKNEQKWIGTPELPHLIKELLETNGLKEGAAGAAGEESQKRAAILR
jgi:hypothetical protein